MPSKASRVTTPKSAALLYNNLTSNGHAVAYVHGASAVIVPDNLVTNGGTAQDGVAKTIAEPDGAQIQQIRWVQLSHGELLVLASARSVQIYTPDGTRLLHVVTAAVNENDAPSTYRGIGGCSTGAADYVCVGVSTGAVCLVPLLGPQAFGDALLSPAATHEIVDLCAGQAPHNDPSRALVCSADAAGDVHCHALEADGTWGHCTTFPVATHDGTPSLCTCTRMRGVRLYCAYSTGHVRIFDLVSCCLSVMITAHPRWVNALEVHPNGVTFATAAEDTLLNVWALHEPAPKVVHVTTIPVADHLLTGLAFCGGPDRSHVAAAAYDVAALQAWRLD